MKESFGFEVEPPGNSKIPCDGVHLTCLKIRNGGRRNFCSSVFI